MMRGGEGGNGALGGGVVGRGLAVLEQGGQGKPISLLRILKSIQTQVKPPHSTQSPHSSAFHPGPPVGIGQSVLDSGSAVLSRPAAWCRGQAEVGREPTRRPHSQSLQEGRASQQLPVGSSRGLPPLLFCPGRFLG